MMGAGIAGFALLLAIIALGAWALHRAPTCTCGDPECGGGCLGKRRK